LDWILDSDTIPVQPTSPTKSNRLFSNHTQPLC